MLFETVEDLIAAFRSDVDDATSVDGSDNLWSDTDALRYANAAIDKTAKETLSLHEVLTLTLTASQPLVVLPRRVLHIRGARLGSNNLPVRELNLNEHPHGIDDDYGHTVPSASALFSSPPGTPRWYVRDYDPRGLYLCPASAEDDTLIAQCSVTVEEALLEDDDFPFTDSDDTELVLLWMKRMAYLKHDAETYDMQRSREYEEQFFARARDRRSESSSFKRRPGTVRMQW